MDAQTFTFKIALVENDPAEAARIRAMLQPPFEVVLFTDPGLASGQLEIHPADLVLMSLALPGAAGLNALDEIGMGMLSCPVVLIGTAADEELRDELIARGAQELLCRDRLSDCLPGMLRSAIRRKKIELELRRIEERFRIVSRATNDVIWDWDLATNKVWWSENVQTLFRYSKDEVGDDLNWWAEKIHPSDAPRFWSSVDAVIHSGWQFWSGEYRFRRGDGTYLSVLDRGYVVQDGEGTPVRMIGTMLDMTDRKRAEEALRKYSNVLTNALEGISTIDPEGRYVSVNRAYAEILGYTPEDLVGKNWEDFLHADDREGAKNAYRQMLLRGKADFESRGLRQDGSIIHQ
ncbi:MAG: PAS domain-containing protein, partial [Verrucomicrobiae bacterium]|nr:PAS domain-containing protein [Verrucomicrobiae bacterium]